MYIGVPREIAPGEKRVAITPESVKRLKKLGFSLIIEKSAGVEADCDDSAYEEAGAEIADNAALVWSKADIIAKVEPPEAGDLIRLPQGKTLISYIWPAQNKNLLDALAKKNTTVLAMDAIPRISRAQKLDARSSMANISGYRAVIEAANNFGSFFTGQMTAAGKVPPAKVLIIGAGVAGLAAIGAARGLGAAVRAFDTRKAAQEQVTSLGAEFLTIELEESGEGSGGYGKSMSEEFLRLEHELFDAQAKEVDIIVTTALIPGKEAPKLITEQAVKNLKPGSVIVDLAAEQGGNCVLTQKGKIVTAHGVTIIGYTDWPSRMSKVASNLYGNNIFHLLDDMGGNDNYKIDEEDEVVRGCLVLRDGELKWPPPPVKVEAPKPKKAPQKVESAPKTESPAPATSAKPSKKPATNPWPMLLAGLALLAVGWGGSGAFLGHFTVFILACFVGYQVVWSVTAALHTPLMSVTNAISGIIIVGGMLQLGTTQGSAASILGVIAIFFATINIAGGFLVTQRMLKMFQR